MMKVKTIDHISICVPNVEAASKLFCDIFGAKFEFFTESEALECRMAFHTWGDKIVTMEEPTTATSTFAKFLEKHGPGIHHMALEVEDLEETIKSLASNGVKVVNTQLTGRVRREALVLPKDAFGILLQLIEWREECKGSLEEQLNLSRVGGLQIPVGDSFKKKR